jgi:hypothetical protein
MSINIKVYLLHRSIWLVETEAEWVLAFHRNAWFVLYQQPSTGFPMERLKPLIVFSTD